MRKNVFIVGLDDFQRNELATIRNAENYAFHGLLDCNVSVAAGAHSFNALLEQACRELKAFPGRVDAIIAHWDFPTSVLVPALCREYGIPAPPLDSVFKCEHKLWSRVEQKRAIPACVPRFSGFDPFDDDALEQIGLDFPFWIKPVKSFSSQLGFKINDADEFHNAVARIREDIHLVGNGFDEALDLVDLPEEICTSTGCTCIAEEIIHGVQAAPEGSVFRGEFNVHGIVDMHKDAAGNSFDRLTYPSALPERIQQRMINACRTFLAHIGFDNGCFNAEFMWDESNDDIRLIEVNTRISQAHSDMFAKVDGMSNHEVAIDVAQGMRPRMPHRKGRYRVAAQCMITHDEDGIITRVPDENDLRRFRERFPDTYVKVGAKADMRLSDLHNQGSYRYILGTVYLGADSHQELETKFQDCLQALPFEFAPLPEAALATGNRASDTAHHRRGPFPA